MKNPDPAEFGITQWVNAYRSGDYIGRYLWGVSGVNREAWTPVGPMQTDWNPSKGVPLQVWFDDQGNGRISRLEFSIGAWGAHPLLGLHRAECRRSAGCADFQSVT